MNYTHVNYSVQRRVQHFVPITIDVYIDENKATSIQCLNESIPDRNGREIGQVFFTEQCKNVTVVINKFLTVNLTLELEVKLTEKEQQCNTDLIGPQSEYVHSLHSLIEVNWPS